MIHGSLFMTSLALTIFIFMKVIIDEIGYFNKYLQIQVIAATYIQ